MPITPFRNSNSLVDFNVYQPDFIGRPVEDISKMVAYRNTQDRELFNQASAIDQAMANVNINQEDAAGRALLDEQRTAFKQGIGGLTDAENYRMAPAIINRLSNDFISNKGIQAAVANQADYLANREALKTKYEKGKISDVQYKTALNQTPIQTDIDDTGNYSRFTPIELINKYNIKGDLENYAKTFKADTYQTRPKYRFAQYDENGNGIGSPIGVDYVRTKGKDLNRLTTGLYNTIASNPEAMNYAQQEADFRGIKVDDYINSLANPILEGERGADLYNMGSLFSPNQLKTKGDKSGLTGRTYIGSQFVRNLKIPAVNQALDQLRNSQYLNEPIKTTTKKGAFGIEIETPAAKGMASSVKRQGQTYDFNLDLENLTPEQAEVYTTMTTVLQELYGDDKTFDNATITERKKALESIDKRASINSDYYESALGAEIDYNAGKAITNELFNTDKLLSSNDFSVAGRFTQGSIFNPYTNEHYDDANQFINALKKGDIKVRDKDGDKNLDNDEDLELRVVSTLNNGNSIPSQTNDYSFVDGYIINIGGYDFIWGDSSQQNPKDIYTNILNQAYTTNLPIEIGDKLDILGINLPNKYTQDQLNDIEITVDNNGNPQVAVYEGKYNKRKENTELTRLVNIELAKNIK